MGITITSRGAGIYNFPKDTTSRVQPSDLIVDSVSSENITSSFESGGLKFVLSLEGNFNVDQVLVGSTVAEASSAGSGTLSKSTSTFSGSFESLETKLYSIPKELIPVTSFDKTLDDLELEWSGDDIFIGDREVPQADTVHGYAGNDHFVMTYSQGTSEKFRGGDGIDTVVIESESIHWKLTPTETAWNSFTREADLDGYYLTDTRHKDTGTYGVSGHVLTAVEVERIEFTDLSLALDLDGAAGLTVKTLAAVVGEDGLSNRAYVGIGLDLFDAGATLESVCNLALSAVGAETNEQVVQLLYTNLYGEAPTEEVARPFIELLENGIFTKAGLAAAAAELTDDLGVIDLVGLTQTGVEFV